MTDEELKAIGARAADKDFSPSVVRADALMLAVEVRRLCEVNALYEKQRDQAEADRAALRERLRWKTFLSYTLMALLALRHIADILFHWRWR